VTDRGISTYVFDSTNGALWAEEVAQSAGIPVEVVPSPPDSDALCDLALVTRSVDGPALEETLRHEGVPFRSWPH
jgi:hypothetical protein